MGGTVAKGYDNSRTHDPAVTRPWVADRVTEVAGGAVR